MKMLTKVTVLIGLALFLANASFAQQVKTDYDRAAHFSQYKTYSWGKALRSAWSLSRQGAICARPTSRTQMRASKGRRYRRTTIPNG